MSTFKEIMDNTTQYKLNNYKIPLKSDVDNKEEEKTKQGQKSEINLQMEHTDIFQTPLSYVEPNTPGKFDTMRFKNSYQHSGATTDKYAGRKRSYVFTPPPPPPPPIPEEEFIKRYPYLKSSTFPEPLKKLLKPLACELCSVRLNSRISGTMHYDSKNHLKKVHIWLQEWEKQPDEPASKREKLVKDSLSVGPNAHHCEACDIPLTSVQHAEQHYSGKKHRAVVMGISKPTGSEYCDSNRKWIRTQPVAANFYRPSVTNIKSEVAVPNINSTDPSIFCSLCNIQVSRESQMKAHLEGSKHLKKLRILQAPPYVASHDTLCRTKHVLHIYKN